MTPDIITEVYKVGGIVLVLLVLLCIVVVWFGKFLINLVHSQNTRIDTIQSEKTEIIMNHISANTECLRNLIGETKDIKNDVKAINKTLRIEEMVPPSQPQRRVETETLFHPVKYPTPKPH